MSLQIWLPLNKENDFQNKGLANVTVTNLGAAYNADGKIGGCYTNFKNANSCIKTSNITFGDKITYTAWVKLGAEALTAGTKGILGHFNHSIFLGISVYPLSGQLTALIGDGTQRKSYASGYKFIENTWTHIAVIYENSTISFFVNGVFIKKHSTITMLPYNGGVWIGRWSSTHNNYYSSDLQINDVRIYDYALSQKEITELRKGLILHYPLNDAYVESTTNIFPYPTPGNSYSTNWDKDLHKNAISVSNWTSGYNSGVTNPSTVYHAHWILMDGEPTMRFPYITNDLGQTPTWLGISLNSGILNTSHISNGTVYTVSFDGKADENDSGVLIGLYYKLTEDGSLGFYDGRTNVKLTTEWKRYLVTYTCKYQVYSISRFYFYGICSGPKGNRYIKNVQLEIKDHATPYTKNTRNGEVWDCSGYLNNGSITGTLTTNTDTARYDKSTEFLADAIINIPTLTCITSNNPQTLACWFKTQGLGEDMTLKGLICLGYGDSLFLSKTGMPSFKLDDGALYNITKFSKNLHDNVWHHLAGTYDGTNASLYLDGKLVSTLPVQMNNRYISSGKFAIGTEANNSQVYKFNGLISDVRIYATVLSEKDIKELYDTSAIIDNLLNLFTYEFIEDVDSVINKEGIVNSSSFFEDIPSDNIEIPNVLGIYQNKMKFNQLIEI